MLKNVTFKQEPSDTQLKAQSKAQLAACGLGDAALANPFPEHTGRGKP